MPSPEQSFAAKALSNVFSGASPPPQRCATISGPSEPAVSKGTTESMRHPRSPPEGFFNLGNPGNSAQQCPTIWQNFKVGHLCLLNLTLFCSAIPQFRISNFSAWGGLGGSWPLVCRQLRQFLAHVQSIQSAAAWANNAASKIDLENINQFNTRSGILITRLTAWAMNKLSLTSSYYLKILRGRQVATPTWQLQGRILEGGPMGTCHILPHQKQPSKHVAPENFRLSGNVKPGIVASNSAATWSQANPIGSRRIHASHSTAKYSNGCWWLLTYPAHQGMDGSNAP